MKKTCGFVSIIGNPNCGKSTFINSIIKSPLALVSKKANATRKRANFIVPFKNENLNSQIIFIDTPGLHESKKLLNEYMINEAKKAISGSDICLYMAVARRKNAKELEDYKKFIDICEAKPHILLLNKIDRLENSELLECIDKYKNLSYQSLIPIRANNLKENVTLDVLYELAKILPEGEHLYEEDLISTNLMREFYKEAIREAIFDRCNDEIPYVSDVIINEVKEDKISKNGLIDYIKAEIIVEKEAQKIIMIGSNANNIKSIGIISRKKCEKLSGKKVFIDLNVKVVFGWSKKVKYLKKIGYNPLI